MAPDVKTCLIIDHYGNNLVFFRSEKADEYKKNSVYF